MILLNRNFVSLHTISPGKLPNPANTITGRENEVKDIVKT
uniref:Uncharacterized protein n=1 Tax=Arundo donax TaxID=35708 RepID=A0A0A9HQM3_ARUDO